MKTFLRGIALSALFGAAHSTNWISGEKQSGENCAMSVDVTCHIVDEVNMELNGKTCEILANELCASRTLKFTYTYCNMNEAAVDLYTDLTTPKLRNQVISINKGRMAPNECRTKIEERTYNTCEVGNAPASMKLEGYIAGFQSVKSYYCYGYKHIVNKLRTPDLPDAVEASPQISLTIKSDFKSDSSSSYHPTTELATYSEKNEFDCSFDFRFTYTVLNKVSSTKIALAALIGLGNVDLLQSTSSIYLEPGESYEKVKYEKIDICKRNGITITTKAIAVATGIPGLLPGTASQSDTFSTPFIVPTIEPAGLECIYKGQSCAAYVESEGCPTAEVEVDFKYIIKKTDLACHDIDQVKIRFGEDTNERTMSLDNGDECTPRTFCHGNERILAEKRFIDICNRADSVAKVVDIGIHCTFNGSSEGDVAFQWTQPVAPDVDDPYVEPDDKPDSEIPHFGKVCSKRADKLYFLYTGDGCDKSDNDQQAVRRLKKKKGNSYSCADTSFNSNPNGVTVVINDEPYNNVEIGQIILVEGGPTTMTVVINAKQANIEQTVSFHSSCSGIFKIGDTFGALKLIGFVNDKDGDFYDASYEVKDSY